MASEQLSPAERLRRLREQHHQLLLIDSHEEAGNLTAETAACYRVHVLRGGSIFGFPLDGPNAAESVKKWEETNRALRQDGRRWLLQHRAEAVGARVSHRAPRQRRANARAPRRRSVRTGSRQAGAPGSSSSDDDPPKPPLVAVPVERFRADVGRWLRGAA
jgi:hypothetical protein